LIIFRVAFRSLDFGTTVVPYGLDRQFFKE